MDRILAYALLLSDARCKMKIENRKEKNKMGKVSDAKNVSRELLEFCGLQEIGISSLWERGLHRRTLWPDDSEVTKLLRKGEYFWRETLDEYAYSLKKGETKFL